MTRDPNTPDLPESELRTRLAAARVAILGCGGLGSNIAAMLVRSGVRTFVLADHDRVEAGNLNRQLFFRDQIGLLKTEALATTLRRIDSGLDLTLVSETVTTENLADLVADADVVIEAVDSAETKATIVDTCTRELPNTPLVTASGLAGYDPANTVRTAQLAEHVWVVGDLASDVREGHALLSPRVMTAAAHQAHAAVRIILGLDPVGPESTD